MTIKTWLTGLATGLALTLATAAHADWEPRGPLTLQIGFGAGGSTDTIGRIVAKVMKDQTGWNVIAENKPGGGGIAMFTGIANRPADGQVIGLGVNMPILVNLVNRPDQLNFDLDSFDYLGTAARAQLALIARADAPFDDIAGLIDYARENNAPLAFDAKPQELAMRKVMADVGVEFQFLSTKGGAENTKLILGGQAIAGFEAGEHLDLLEAGELKMIASMNDSRHNYAPDTPTLPEQGFDIYVDPVFFFAAAAGTPDDARMALTQALENALASEDVATVVMNSLKSPIVNMGPEGTEQMMRDGVENVAQLFK
ncbi:tripartite tricarboxylate transporter substrate binding protein [Aestuariivita sp.]|jgi:tripartite-type tricarboxylate transporter receptor subunit TctC|uniref:tripartite tricarboxylate transporter substrate binding protein n=1 Tax=Aestuariivita sp. TaxID=1872407 RepID=UPI00217457F0|nr:tripartite tricarboxylate transporter substrate binding protein [Aestuariivita sp.]MCE8006254.1 tripartite tricarboxylate transporter substrate binding protein [Aestuariivita sp.]